MIPSDCDRPIASASAHIGRSHAVMRKTLPVGTDILERRSACMSWYRRCRRSLDDERSMIDARYPKPRTRPATIRSERLFGASIPSMSGIRLPSPLPPSTGFGRPRLHPLLVAAS
ncbi:hypothetical protein [Thioalkalivibrio sp. HK1]|uniref:hypothetical protein n=1 Tax=Thioalkalivibrio sp. HK1 TaxID=1469245 RepID=UPI001E445804|nr:hypothetical protein [Thioalkalivibrio sp. HK1]